MKFKVSKLTDIICEGCGGVTRVTPQYTYKIDDLTCNCPHEGELFGRADKAELTDAPIDNTPKPKSNSKVQKAANMANRDKQTKMFEEEPENVFEEETMTREDVAEYLKGLVWQELLNSAKNNNVAKPPSVKRDELELMILDAVFGDGDTVVSEKAGDTNEE